MSDEPKPSLLSPLVQKIGALLGAIILVIVQGIYTAKVTDAATSTTASTTQIEAVGAKLERYGEKLDKVVTAQELQNLKLELHEARITKLEAKGDDAAKVHSAFDVRLTALERTQK